MFLNAFDLSDKIKYLSENMPCDFYVVFYNRKVLVIINDCS